MKGAYFILYLFHIILGLVDGDDHFVAMQRTFLHKITRGVAMNGTSPTNLSEEIPEIVANGDFETFFIDGQQAASISSWTYVDVSKMFAHWSTSDGVVITNYNTPDWGGAGNKWDGTGNYYIGLQGRSSATQVISLLEIVYFKFIARSRPSGWPSSILEIQCGGVTIFGPEHLDSSWRQFSTSPCIPPSESSFVTLVVRNNCDTEDTDCTSHFDQIVASTAELMYAPSVTPSNAGDTNPPTLAPSSIPTIDITRDIICPPGFFVGSVTSSFSRHCCGYDCSSSVVGAQSANCHYCVGHGYVSCYLPSAIPGQLDWNHASCSIVSSIQREDATMLPTVSTIARTIRPTTPIISPAPSFRPTLPAVIFTVVPTNNPTVAPSSCSPSIAPSYPTDNFPTPNSAAFSTSSINHIVVQISTGVCGWYLRSNVNGEFVLQTPAIEGLSIVSGFFLKATQQSYSQRGTPTNQRLQIVTDAFSVFPGSSSLASFNDIRMACSVVPISALVDLLPSLKINQNGEVVNSGDFSSILSVVYNGEMEWASSGRYYHAVVIQGSFVPGWYLAHDVIHGSGDSIFALGSWNFDCRILGKQSLNSQEIHHLLSNSQISTLIPSVLPSEVSYPSLSSSTLPSPHLISSSSSHPSASLTPSTPPRSSLSPTINSWSLPNPTPVIAPSNAASIESRCIRRRQRKRVGQRKR